MKYTGERYLPGIDVPETSYEHWHRYQYATLFVENWEVLDIACGEGYGSYLLAKTAKRVVGIDISEEVVNQATSKYMLSNLLFKQGSIDSFPVEGESLFDAVISFETIEHVDHERQVAFMREVKRVLKPDGFLLVSTPNKLSYSDVPSYQNEFHEKEFYVDEFEGFLRSYFNHVTLVGQRVYPGSYLWNLKTQNKQLIEFKINTTSAGFRPTGSDKVPIYVIAHCTDAQPENPPHSLQIDLSNRMARGRDEEIWALRDRIADGEARLEDLRQELRDEIVASEEKILEQAIQLQERDQANLSFAQQVKALTTRIGALDDLLAERDVQVRGLSESLTARNEQIEVLKGQLHETEMLAKTSQK